MKYLAGIACCIFLLVLIVAAPACKKMPMFALDGATLVVSADKINLRTGGDRAVVTVVGFSEDGEPLHDHTLIVFTATLGTIPASAEMVSGRAMVEFISGDRSGVAAIEARSGSITATPTPLEIAIGSGALKTLTVHADPARLGAKGGKSLISVYAFDESQNLLADIPVVLSTTAGKLDRGNSVRFTDMDGMISEYLHTEETATVSAESGSISADIEVKVEENELPSADFSISPADPGLGETVYFNGSASSDPDGSIAGWEWDFGDGATASGQETTHAYDAAGSFSVTLKVTDNSGGSGSAEKTVTIATNQLPSADFSISPAGPKTGETVYFNGSASSDPDGSITGWEWNFGDGRSGRGEKTSHVYTRSGTFSVTLKVTDDNGGNASVEKTVTIIAANQLPSADFSISPAGPKTGETVYFNASASSDPDGSITGWEWDFGDGGKAGGLETSHVYGAAGTFTVTLTVTDDSGGSDTCQKTVILTD